jgi:hypothetical protein
MREGRMSVFSAYAAVKPPVADRRGIPPVVHDTLRSPGQPPAADVRAFFEPRFGHDFSRVRVHREPEAAESARGGPAVLLSRKQRTVSRQAVTGSPATLAGVTATRDAFRNTGAPDAANCARRKPAALGVDGPRPGANGMEMIFKLSGRIPAGTEFDITRTKATGTWEKDAAGRWSRLGGDPAGTSDDHHDDDECLTPVASRIFVVDRPGMGSLDARGQVFPDGTRISATAKAGVRKHSFAEWVIARNRARGIGWTRISTPALHRWHSIVSVADVAGVWTRVDTPSGKKNEIKLGPISTTGGTP